MFLQMGVEKSGDDEWAPHTAVASWDWTLQSWNDISDRVERERGAWNEIRRGFVTCSSLTCTSCVSVSKVNYSHLPTKEIRAAGSKVLFLNSSFF